MDEDTGVGGGMKTRSEGQTEGGVGNSDMDKDNTDMCQTQNIRAVN